MTYLKPADPNKLVVREDSPTHACPFSPGYPVMEVEDDEISLIDLLITMLRYKKLIIAITCIAGLIGFFAGGFSREELYISEAIIIPQQGGIASFGGINNRGRNQFSIGQASLEKLLMTLDSRQLTARVIEKHELMPVLFPESWDENKKSWKSTPAPTMQMAHEAMKKLLEIGLKTNKRSTIRLRDNQRPISVGIQHKDATTAKQIVDYYLVELSESLRGRALHDAIEKMRFLEDQLDKTLDPLMQDKIHLLRAREVEKATFAKAQKYYGFTVIDPPVIPDQISTKGRFRIRNTVLAGFAAFFLSLFFVFFIDFFRRMKRDNKAKYEEFIGELKTWRKK